MNQKVFLDNQKFSIQELEKRLQFKYLSQNAFESKRDRDEIHRRGLKKLQDLQVSQEAQDLGKKWIDSILSSYISNVSVRFIHETVGFGLFSEEDLSVGTFVGEYTGLVRKNDRRYTEPLNNYCYEYPVPDNLGRSYVIDATQGNLTRFINHSFHPNLKPFHVFYDGFYHLIFLTIFPIQKGAQLFYNYGNSYWYIREPPTLLK